MSLLHCKIYAFANLLLEYCYCKAAGVQTLIQLDCSVSTRDARTPIAVLYLIVIGSVARCPPRALNLLFSASS